MLFLRQAVGAEFLLGKACSAGLGESEGGLQAFAQKPLTTPPTLCRQNIYALYQR